MYALIRLPLAFCTAWARGAGLGWGVGEAHVKEDRLHHKALFSTIISSLLPPPQSLAVVQV